MAMHRGFVALPLVILLGLSAAALGVVYGMNAPARQTTSSAYNRGNTLGPMLGLPVVALFFVWQSGRWAERRGTRSANLVFGGILAAMNVAVGINAYRVTLGKPGASQPVARGSGALSAASPSQQTRVTQAGPEMTKPSWPSADIPEQGPHQRSARRDAVSVPASGSPPTGPTPSQIAEVEADAKAKPIFELFRTKMLEECGSAADAVEGFVAGVSKPPKHDKRELRKRAEDAAALRNLLLRLEKRLKGAVDDLEAELKAGGIEAFDARHRAVRSGMDLDAARRQFAAADLVRLCDRVKAECEVLDREFSAWTLTNGEITVRDVKKRHALTTERFFIEAETRNILGTVNALREGR